MNPQRSVHLVGIGGAGMSGIARILVQRGHAVSGSDLRDGHALQELRALGARIEVGHRAENLGEADVVVTSTAVPVDNVEVVAARASKTPVLRRAEMLARLMEGERSLLIAGTHGKTTTTSMTVVALQSAGCDPTFAIGGSLNESGTNAHAGGDPVFVAEADESDRSFLVFRPDVAVVTNVEHDHPEEFPDLEATVEAFLAFLGRRPPGAPAVLCSDDPVALALADTIEAPVVLYGSDPRADVRVVDGPDPRVHRIRHRGEEIAELALSVPGWHNVINATGALAACLTQEVDVVSAARGLTRFTGAVRRFQQLGTVAGVSVVDDYAHHPTELRATLAAARSLSPSRVVLVVQPHRYSRTRVLGDELGRAAAAADLVIVTDVYASGENPVPGVSGRIVARAAHDAGANVSFVEHLSDVVDALASVVEDGDLVLVTGAGDVTHVGPALLERIGGRR